MADIVVIAKTNTAADTDVQRIGEHARVINPNEARAWEGLPPYSGGEQFANPNITTASAAPGEA